MLRRCQWSMIEEEEEEDDDDDFHNISKYKSKI